MKRLIGSSSPEQRLLSPHGDVHEWISADWSLWADSQRLKPVKNTSPTANFSIFLPSIHPSANLSLPLCLPQSLQPSPPQATALILSSISPPPCSHRSFSSPLFHLPSSHFPLPFFSFLPPSLQCQSVLSMWTGAEASLCPLPLLLSYLFHSWQACEGNSPRWQMKGWISTCIILTLSRRRTRHSSRRPAALSSTQPRPVSVHMDAYKCTAECRRHLHIIELHVMFRDALQRKRKHHLPSEINQIYQRHEYTSPGGQI